MSIKVEASIRGAHNNLTEEFEFVQSEVIELLKKACELRKWTFEDRLKTVESYAMKLMTGRYLGYDIDDFYACTIVVPNLREVLKAIDFVKSSVNVVKEKPGMENKSQPTHFDFDSVRMYCTLPESVNPKPYQSSSFEIQIKTLLEHAWSKATHDFSYKGDEVSWARERLAAQIKAVLDNVDLSINEMENTARSNFLDKKNPKYEKLRNVVAVLKSEFGASDSSHTISDYKRLAEQVLKVLERTELTVEKLGEVLVAEAKNSRGRLTVNLSPYSIVLVSLAKQVPNIVQEKLNTKPKSTRSGKIVVPHEVTELWGVDPSSFKAVLVLGQD